MATPSLAVEEWRPVVGYEGFYEVSSFGRVRSLHTKWRHLGTRPIKLTPLKSGYLYAMLWDGKKRKNCRVNVLVARAFIGPPPAGAEVNHQDGVKPNNRADNLEYLSKSGNIQHAYDSGLINPSHGEARPNAVLTDRIVVNIRERVARGEHPADLEREYDLSRGYASQIARGEIWARAGGPIAERQPVKRGVTGQRNGRAKVQNRIDEIVRRVAGGEPRAAVAESLGVSRGTIDRIIRLRRAETS